MVVAVVAATVLSCTHKPTETLPVLPATVSFQGNILPLFASNCSTTGCHAGSSPAANLDLTAVNAYVRLFAKKEIDTVNPSNSFLYMTMNSTGTPMPPTGKLGANDIGLVLKWIQQGARNN